MIGSSSGNGHPYSFSAILNGYDPDEMAKSPFPNIAAYLGKQTFPEEIIDCACVTHIWTQDIEMTMQIAKTTFIPNPVSSIEDMLGKVDGVIIARDDPEERSSIVKFFLKRGIPLFVDKPLATTESEVDMLLNEAHEDWRLFSSSGVCFSPEILSLFEKIKGKNVLRIEASTPKNWKCYASHIVEPSLLLTGLTLPPEKISAISNQGRTMLMAAWDDGPLLSLCSLGAVSQRISFRVHLGDDVLDCRFQSSFKAFKAMLSAFLEQIATKKVKWNRAAAPTVASIIQKGMCDEL